jgi:hypothetical protein
MKENKEEKILYSTKIETYSYIGTELLKDQNANFTFKLSTESQNWILNLLC